MTTELTKAAQQALEALRANAIHYGDPLRCSRDAIAALERALTQRPAAQEVASYFSYGEDAGYLEHATAEAAREQAKADIRGYRNDAMHDNEWPSEVDSVCWGVVLQKATAVDNSEEAGQESFEYELGPAPQQATPASAPQSLLMRLAGIAAECSDPDTTDALDALIAAPQQATPEPVGEVVWIQPNHLQMARVAPHLCRVAPTRIAPDFVPLSTRPAPGVPEVDDLAQFIRRIDGKHSMGAGALAEHICDWLAAAQAKGGESA